MKITRRQLRKLIISEALNFDKFKDCALYKETRSGLTMYVLFNLALINPLSTMSKDPNIWPYYVGDLAIKTPHMYGMVVTRDAKLPCNAAQEIIMSAAKPGWGPTMYDIVMGDNQFGIIGDRGSVSPDAFNVYKYYNVNRTSQEQPGQPTNDVEKFPLDHTDHKWTKAPYDDCTPGSIGKYLTMDYYDNFTHQSFLKDPLSWSYNRDVVPNRDVLDANMEKVEDYLVHQEDFNVRQVRSIFRIMGKSFFASNVD